ncbi:phospholipid scramblase family member 5 [Gouania willdenowi]|uniref:phospholipid scramblase family member 5 n=1 Tax=Gouania willdenowi TaxID=441366 RepID=UPI001054CAF9|nr:phospholipid scramblase family member 5-like [Gouania willdenowi]
MSAVTNQPLPIGQLEREKHIEMIFRTFQSSCGPSCISRAHLPKPGVSLEPHEYRPNVELPGLNAGNKRKEYLQQKAHEMMSRAQREEQDFRDADFLSELEMVSQVHITARPQLQGPQCVSQKIYSIAAEDRRKQMCAAVEESSCVCLQCCGPARACFIRGYDCQGRQVFYFERPLRVDACCLGCCLMEMRVYAPQKHLIGKVCQRWSMFTPLLEVCDADGASTVRIHGSCCPCRCVSDQQFQIVSNMGERIGTIWKKWSGFNDECNMDHEYFGLKVPPCVHPHTKLLLLAATFLLNHMYFEMS